MKMKENSLIDQITAELKNQIQMEELCCDVPEFNSAGALTCLKPFSESSRHHLEESMLCTQILEDSPIEYDRKLTSYFPFLSFIVIPIKKLIKKIVRFLLEPMIDEINANRKITAAALFELQTCVHENENFGAMQEMLSDLREELEVLKSDNLYLKETIKTMQQRGKDAS